MTATVTIGACDRRRMSSSRQRASQMGKLEMLPSLSSARPCNSTGSSLPCVGRSIDENRLGRRNHGASASSPGSLGSLGSLGIMIAFCLPAGRAARGPQVEDAESRCERLWQSVALASAAEPTAESVDREFDVGWETARAVEGLSVLRGCFGRGMPTCC
jgi:hypothetical protein